IVLWGVRGRRGNIRSTCLDTGVGFGPVLTRTVLSCTAGGASGVWPLRSRVGFPRVLSPFLRAGVRTEHNWAFRPYQKPYPPFSTRGSGEPCRGAQQGPPPSVGRWRPHESHLLGTERNFGDYLAISWRRTYCRMPPLR